MPAWQREKPAFAYAIPTFQNPSGRCLDAHQRDALAAACDAADVPLFEDDPYRDLVYDACERTPVCGRLRSAPWVYQGSFSKSLAPGLRLGYLAASPELLPFLTRLKQAADLHSNRVSQWLVLQQLNDPACEQRLQELALRYRERRDAFEAALRRHFGDIASWQHAARRIVLLAHLAIVASIRASCCPKQSRQESPSCPASRSCRCRWKAAANCA